MVLSNRLESDYAIILHKVIIVIHIVECSLANYNEKERIKENSTVVSVIYKNILQMYYSFTQSGF